MRTLDKEYKGGLSSLRTDCDTPCSSSGLIDASAGPLGKGLTEQAKARGGQHRGCRHTPR